MINHLKVEGHERDDNGIFSQKDGLSYQFHFPFKINPQLKTNENTVKMQH